MHAHIVLDQSWSHYTNLDIISGKVTVVTPSSANISSIVVKLEGESRTRLLPPPNPNGDRQRAQLEFHKILYKVQIVFPPPDVFGEKQNHVAAGNASKTTFTLPPGSHEYPFKFKLPFNNDCTRSSSGNPTVSLFGGLTVDLNKNPLEHVKRTLPPTLTGFPGQAEIRYYAKVTVNRPNMFKENARAYIPFNFCPIEPPRPPPSDSQAFARRRHQFFNPHASEMPLHKSKIKILLGKDKRTLEAPSQPGAPELAIDMRLPEPAILTCAREIPLRIVIGSSNGRKEGLSVQSLQIELISITHVRAQGVGRTEQSSTIIMSRSNIGMLLRFAERSEEVEVDRSLWRDYKLPNTIPPSFVACNITRAYELVVRVCVKYEPAGFKPQYTTADLKLPVQVYSGIAPPQRLLDALARAQAVGQKSAPNSERPPALPTRRPAQAPASTSAQASMYAPGESTDEAPPLYSELPPSYEDTVEQEVNLDPVEGIRREYAPPVAAEDPLLRRDEKS